MLRLLLALALASLFCARAAAAPLEAYGKLPTIESANVSPSGHAVALMLTNGEDRMIVVQDLATKALTYRAATGRAKVRHVSWAGDEHLIVVTTITASPLDVISNQREWAMGFSVDLKRKKLTPLLHDAEQAMNTIYGLPVVRNQGGEPVLFLQGVKFVSNHGRVSLFRVDLDRGRSRLVGVGALDTRDWVVGADGEPAAQELYHQKSGRYILKLKDGAGWREAVTTTALNDPPYMMGLSRDGKAVLLAVRDGEERLTWREVPFDETASGSAIPVTDGHSPLYDSQDGRLIGHSAMVGDTGRHTFFDPTDQKIWKAVIAAFPDASVELKSWSADHRKIVVRVDSPADGPAYALVDIDARNATWLGAEYQDLKAADVSPQSAIRYKAADGLELGGYLTLPRGREAKGLPLIVFPHGGPAGRDMPGFDWWAQAMASRGYAVLQVNFRGSEGLGDQLLEAGYGQWGRKMQTDLSDGVRHLAAEGVIDPARVCIVGHSYGGYAALAGATLDRGVYRCAVSSGGLSDLGRFVSWSRSKQGHAAFRYWTRFMGAEEDRSAALAEISPVDHADKVTVPILLIHGQDDSVVPIEQSRVMADALKGAGRPYEFLVQKGEDHWLSRGETRVEMLKATMAFVEKHNPPE